VTLRSRLFGCSVVKSLLLHLGHLQKLVSVLGVPAGGEGGLEVAGLGSGGGVDDEGVLDGLLEVFVRLVQLIRLSRILSLLVIHQDFTCPLLKEVHLGLSKVKVLFFLFFSFFTFLLLLFLNDAVDLRFCQEQTLILVL